MPTRLVLVGAGHAHLAVLDALAREPLEGVETTLIAADPRQFHPALLTDAVRGTTPFDAITLDVAALARRSGARLKIATAAGIDRSKREISLGDGLPLRYDVLSLAIGAGLAGADREGVRTWALMTRPTAEAAALGPALDGVARRKAGTEIRLVVVGGGRDAVELALAARARLSPGCPLVHTTILPDGPGLLSPERGPAAAALTRRLATLGVAVRHGAAVERLDAGEVFVAGGERVPADAVIWATAPAPHPLARAIGLSADRAGAVQVDAWLRSVDDPLVFAAGHVATSGGAPVDPIAAGAILAHNLLCVCTGTGPLRRYRTRPGPTLLATGKGRALVEWGPVRFEAGWPHLLRQRRARRYLARFSGDR